MGSGILVSIAVFTGRIVRWVRAHCSVAKNPVGFASRVALLSALVLCACDWMSVAEPEIAINVIRTGRGYVFRWETARIGSSIAVQGAVVERMLADESHDPICQVVRKDGSGQSLRDSWEYGSAGPGYLKKGCPPLSPGEYNVHLIVAGGVFARFRIAPDGSVQVAGQSSRVE